MISKSLRANTYGWVVVAVLFLVLSLVMVARTSLGLLIPTWESELGWGRTFVSAGGAVMLVVMAVGSPLAGLALDRAGARSINVVGLLIVAAAMLMTAGMTAGWHYILIFGVIGGIGFSAISAPLIGAVVSLYFEEHRGLATGLATSGATGGQLVLMPLLAVSVAAVGWRPSYVVLAAALAATAVLTWVLIRRRPAVARDPAHLDSGGSLAAQLRFLARSRSFWLMGIGYVVCGFTTIGAIRIHFLPYAASCGFPPVQSATAFGVLATFSMIGMIGYGALSDRFHRPLLLASIYFLRAFCFLMLMYVAGDLPLLFLFATIFGIFDFSTFPVVANIAATHIGLRIMGLTMGLLFAFHSVGGAAGSFVGGWLFDLVGQYDWMWILSFALALSAAFLSLFIPETRGRSGMAPAAAAG